MDKKRKGKDPKENGVKGDDRSSKTEIKDLRKGGSKPSTAASKDDKPPKKKPRNRLPPIADTRSVVEMGTGQDTELDMRKSFTAPDHAKTCYFYKEGDYTFSGVKIPVNPRKYKKWDVLLLELSRKIPGLGFGVRSVYTPEARDAVSNLDGLTHEGKYVCGTRRNRCKPMDFSKMRNRSNFFVTRPPSGRRQLNDMLKDDFQYQEPQRLKTVKRDYDMTTVYWRSKPKKITVLKNKEPNIRHVFLLNRRTTRTFEQVLQDLSEMFQFGVKELCDVKGHKISSLNALIRKADGSDGPDVVVAVGVGESFQPMDGKTHIQSRVSSRANISTAGGSDKFIQSRMKTKRERLANTKGRWSVQVSTNKNRHAGTQAQVTLTVYGHKGNSGPIALGNGDGEHFQSGNIDEFDVSVGNVGEIYKIRIGHDNSGDSPGWLCDEISMTDIDTHEELKFTCHRWMARDEDDQEITREIAAVRKGEPILPVIRYEVTVQTGDLWNGGTDANVYITIYGDRGDTGVRQLYSPNKYEIFKQGKTNKFTVESVSLGHLKRIIVGHDGTGNGNGWYLERITIKESGRMHEENNFYNGKWLDEGEDDGKIVRELKIQEEYMDDILEKRHWEHERWRFDKDCQVSFYSLASSKALRAKKDMHVDGLGIKMDPEIVFNVVPKKGMIRMFNSAKNPNHYLAIDNGKITMLGKGGPFCEFRVRVQGDMSIILESVKNPLQFITIGEDGRTQDVRAILDKDPIRRFFVYSKGMFRHRGTIMLNTSSSQSININPDFSLTATGKRGKNAHFMVHKVDTGGVRMFESLAHSGKYIRLKDGKLDCLGSRDEASYFIVEKHPEDGYTSLQSMSQRGLYLGMKPDGRVWPTVDTGVKNICLFPEVVEFGVPKSKSTEIIEQQEMDRDVTPAPKGEPIKKDCAVYVTDDMDTTVFGDGDWGIQVSTLETLDDNADVALVVYGDLGSTGQILLGAPPGKKIFTAGNNDEFRANLSKVGNIYKIRLELIPRASMDPSWKVKDVKMTDLNTQETLLFQFNKWLARAQEDGEIMREQPAKKNGEPVLPLLRYHVLITTGKDDGANTDSLVYINIAGEKGDTGKRLLFQSDNNERPFQCGQTDVFHVEAVSLGTLQKITIGHDGTMAGQGWYLEEVVIREFEDAKEEYIFTCEKWLDTGEEDRKIERVLYVKETRETHPSVEPEVSTIQEEEEESPKEGDWKVWVTTGSKEEMATLNRVLLYIYSTNNGAGPLVLGSGHDGHFKAGATNEFRIDIGNKLGDIYKIRIGHDEEKDSSGWYLEKLKLQDMMISSRSSELTVNRWLSRQQDDCDVWRELPVSFSGKPLLPVVVYTIEVHTGQQQKGLCTSRVSILLTGETGDSGKRRLYQSSSGSTAFNSGSKDIFSLEAVSLGNLEEITVSHDNQGDNPGLYVEKIIISEKQSSEQFYFPCDRWLSKDEGDGKCEVDLKPKPMPKQSKGEFKLSIKTADDSLPSKGGSVFFMVYGESGKSDEIKLHSPNSSASLFEPGNVDTFEVSVGDVGELYKIRLTKQDVIQWEGWHLIEIKMQDVGTGEEYTFHCDRWLSRDKEDYDVIREFPISSKTGSTPAVKTYEVSVYTGNNWGAETDASVFINVFGSIGDTGKRLLFHSKNNKLKFQRGQVDKFEIEAVSLEVLTHVEIGHDRKGHGAGIYIDKVVIIDKDDPGKQFVLPCRSWLDDREGDGRTWRTLPVLDIVDNNKSKPKIDSKKTATKWNNVQVSVKTSDIDNAGTSAQVYITAYGTKGQSDKLLLSSTDSNNFDKGFETEVNVSFGDIGGLTKIRLEHDNTNKSPSWHVDWVKLTAADNDEVVFYINQWFAVDEEDGQILREFPVINQEIVPQPKCQYIIIIETGKQTNASASQGSVFINLIGSHGDTGLRKLTKSLTTNSIPWKPNQEDIYLMEAVSIGKVEKLHVRLEGKGVEEWFIDRLCVFDKVTAIYKSVFNCYTMLSTETDKISVNKEFELSEIQMSATPSKVVDSMYKDVRPKVSKGNWTVWIHCGPDSNGWTKDDIYMIVYGIKGQSKPIQLNDKMEFNQRSIVKIDVNLGDIDAIYKIRLYFGGDYTGSPWFLQSIKMKDHDTLQEVILNVNEELMGTEDNPDGSLELPIIRPDLPPLPEDEFTVYVATGNQDMADTEADVFCCLIGQFGDTGRRMLSKSNCPVPFKKGQVDEFKIKGLDLGSLNKVVIGHNEKGRGRGWYCERVQITSKLNPVMKIFPCNRWMDTGCEDRKLMRELPYLGDMPVVAPSSGTSKGKYTCTVITADKDKLPPKGLEKSEKSRMVSLMVYGSKSVVGPIELTGNKPGSDLFLPGHTDVFKGLSIDVGDIQKIRVCAGYEEDPEPIWTVEKIELEDDDTKDILTFDFSHWVGEVKGAIRKEMPVIKLGKVNKQIYPYHVEVHTSEEEMNAATNSQVFITLYGMLGDSGRRRLFTSRNNKTKFQTGQIDIFTVHAVDLGELEKVVVAKGPGDSWLLEKIVIKTSDFAAQESIFTHEKWIGKKDDKKSEVEETIRLSAVKNSHVVIPAIGSNDLPESKGRWKLTTETGGNKGGDNFGDVVMVLSGEEGETQPMKIETTRDKPFQIGQTDVFDVKFTDDVGELYKIRLGFQDNTTSKGWLIKKLQFEDLDTKDVFSYELKDWVVVDEVNDGWKEIPAAWPAINIPKVIQYQVKTYTGDVRSSGTDADVYVIIHGEMGSTGRRLLKKSKTHDDKFERDQEDVFVVEAVSLGTLQKVVIGHNADGLGSGWYLQKVVITESETATEEVLFPCNQWLCKEEGDGKIERTLFPKRPGSETYRLRDRTPSSKVRPKIPSPVVESEGNEDVSTPKSAAPVPESKTKTPTPEPLIKPPTPEPETKPKSPSPKPKSPSPKPKSPSPEPKVKSPSPEPKPSSPESKVKSPSPEPKIKSPSPEPKLKSPTPEPKVKSPEPEVKSETPEPKQKTPEPEDKTPPQDQKQTTPEPVTKAQTPEPEIKTPVPVPESARSPSPKQEEVKTPEPTPRTEEKQSDEPVESKRSPTPVKSPEPKEQTPEPQQEPEDGDFCVTVVTSEQSKGFNDQVYLTVFGDASNSGQLPLGEPDQFKPGSTETFKVKIELEELGQIRKIRLEHTDLSPGAEWSVEKITLEDLFRKDTMEFKVNKKLTLSEPGSDLSVEIPAHHQHHVWPEYSSTPSVNQYLIEIETGDEDNAGTNERIHINMFGTLGDSGKRYLVHNREKKQTFQRGQTDTFIIEAVDLGRLEALIIGHHGIDPSSDWFLEKVSVKESETDEVKYIFPCGSWLKDDNDLGVAELELYMDRVEKEDAGKNNNAKDEVDGAKPSDQSEQNTQQQESNNDENS